MNQGRRRTRSRGCGGAFAGIGGADRGSFGHYGLFEFGMEMHIISVEAAHYPFAITLETESTAIHGIVHKKEMGHVKHALRMHGWSPSPVNCY